MTSWLLCGAERMVLVSKIYSEEFKASALELLDQGMTQLQVCKDLGMLKFALQAWVNQTRLRERGFEPIAGENDDGEQARMLRRSNHRQLDRPPADRNPLTRHVWGARSPRRSPGLRAATNA